MNMKKIIIALWLFISAGVCFAQSGHMKFKGIPMEGTLNSFVAKLKAKGFTYIGQQDGAAILKGEFAATKNCTIGVVRFSDKDQVNVVGVIFPEQDSWSDIYQSYLSLKEMLTEKYGEPDVSERFSGNDPDSDFYKFYALLNDECHYVSKFTCENGKILLTMKKQNHNTASVLLRYIDKANADETRKKVMDDL